MNLWSSLAIYFKDQPLLVLPETKGTDKFVQNFLNYLKVRR